MKKAIEKNTGVKILSIILCVLLIITSLPISAVLTTAAAASIIASGYCGTKTTWTIDDSGTLTISGTGDMDDFAYWTFDYYDNNQQKSLMVSKVVIGSGVTSFFDVSSMSDEYSAFIASVESITVESGNHVFVSSGNCLIEENSRKLIFGCKNSVIPTDGSVTSIADNAFFNCTGIKSLIIPKTTAQIGVNAFSGCKELEYIVINNSNCTIGNGIENCAIYGWNGSTAQTYANNNKLTFYSLNDHVHSFNIVAQRTKEQCTSCREYVYTRKLCTFCGYDTGIVYGEEAGAHKADYVPAKAATTTETGNEAYYKCAFCDKLFSDENCTQETTIADVTIPISTPEDLSGMCGEKLAWIFSYETGTLTISGTGDMDENCYELWNSFEDDIKKVVIEDGVTSIGKDAFYYCTELTSIEIPGSVTSIGDQAFFYCTGLTSVKIGDNVTSIGSYAFEGCTGLTSIEIPDSVTNISSSAFICCTGLESITVSDKNTVYHSAGNCLIKTGSKTLIQGCNNSVIPANGSVTSIGSFAFDGCTGLTSIEIPDSVTSIGVCAFYNCTGLTSIEIPDSVTSIGNQAFCECTGLENITVSDKNTTYHSAGNCLIETESKTLISGCKNSVIPTDGCVISIGYCAFEYCTGLISIEIPDSVKSIGISAFYGCTGLTSVKIGDGVTSIGYGAFIGCSGLTSIKIGDSVTDIGEAAFYKTAYYNNTANWTDNVLYVGKYLIEAKTDISGKYKIKDGTKVIAPSAFSGCTGLTSIEIPDSVTSIGTFAFDYSGIYNNSDNWQDNVLYIGDCLIAANDDFSIDEYTVKAGTRLIADEAFTDKNLTSVSFPDSLKYIGKEAFSHCSNLEVDYIPDDVIIGEDAFYGCRSIFGECGKNLTWKFSRKTGTLTISGTGDMDENCNELWNSFEDDIKKVVIGDGVTSIGKDAFLGYNDFTSIEIPDSVTSIGDYAFNHCSGLTSIEIPDSVTSIGTFAFNYCFGLTSIEIPSSVTSIGENAFFGIKYITYSGTAEGSPWGAENYNVCAENGLIYTDSNKTVICGYDGSVSEIEIPDSVTSIGEAVFKGCTGLKSLVIGNGVTSIADSAFSGCTGLTSVKIGDGVKSIGEDAFYDCTGLTSVKIGDSVKSIGYKAFYNCTGLTSIEIPDSVINIGSYAFSKCTGLTSITIGDSVTSIGECAFEDCTGLTSIEIPDSVTSIGRWAFSDCTGLTSIEIGDSVTSIGYGAFYGCTGLENITVSDKNTVYHSAGNCLIETESKALILGCKNSVIPADGSVTSIDEQAFEDCAGLTSIEIPNSVTSIGESAFSGCTGLSSITIGNNVTCIDPITFSGCTGLTSIKIPDSVTDIYWGAFWECTGLKSIEIGGGLTSTCGNTFYGCNELESITVSDKNTVYHSAGNCLIETESKTLILGCNNSIIPDDGSVTSIAEDAFWGRTGLTSIEIPDSVISIGSVAFLGCTGLTSIEIGDNVTYIGESAFYDTAYYNNTANWTDNVLYIGNYLIKSNEDISGEYKIKDGTKVIAPSAFSDCTGLTSIEIPDSVTSICSDAFYRCTGLTSITIGNSVTSIGASAFYDTAYYNNNENWTDNVLYVGKYLIKAKTDISGEYKIKDGTKVIAPSAFSDCTGLTSIEIPNSVTRIDSLAFWDCTGLKSIEIPNSVTSIDDNTFLDCSGLESITVSDKNTTYHSAGNCLIETESKTLIQGCNNSIIPDDGSVTSIDAYAFRGCTGLASIEIPDSVTSIADYAFYGCTGLTSVKIGDSVTNIGSCAFYRCTGLTSVKIGDSVKSIGDCAFYECAELTSIEIPVSVTSIGYEAFENCTGLTSIEIPNSVTSIGYEAFFNCTGLTLIEIPESVTSIGSYAFEGCTGLENITVSDKNTVYHSADNCLIETESKTLILGCKNSVIPTDGSVTSIGYVAFAFCAGLTSIEIPDSVISIGDYAFSDCTGLTSVKIGDSVTSIGDCAFYECAGLTSIEIPVSVTSIGYEAFENCSGLTSIEIPGSVTSICSDAFYRCTGLENITVSDKNTVYHSAGNCLIETESKTLILGCKNSVIPADGSVTSIDEYAFDDCAGLTSIEIPDSVKSIGFGAFSDCTGLTSIYIPSSVKNISGWDVVPDTTLILVDAGSYAESWAEENEYAYAYIDSAYVNINAPCVVNDSQITVSGYATPCTEIVLYVNGKENAKITSNANGYYSAQISFDTAGEYTVKASVTLKDKTATKEIKIKYDELSAAFCEFDFVHSYSSLHIASDTYMRGKPSVTWVPGTSSSVKVKITNSDRVSKLYLVSTKNGESKKLELTYNAFSDNWIAAGYFGNDTSYTPGALSITGTYKDGKEFDLGVTFNINFVIDPSGYVYEAVRSNLLDGVTVKICYKDAKGNTVMWNAEEYEQLNPVVTAADGAFAWDVPEGQWKVIASKDGYKTAETEWMDVPPEQKNVYIGLNSNSSPEVKAVNVYSDYALIEFTQYMDISTVNSDNISFNGVDGTFEAVDKTETYTGSGIYYAKLFRFTPDNKFEGKINITVKAVENYRGYVLSSYSKSVTLASEPKNFVADTAVSIADTENGTVSVSIENAGGMTVQASVNNAFVSLEKTSIVLDKDGKGEFVLKGNIPGESLLTFTLDGTELTAKTNVTVTPAISAHIHSMKKISAVAATCTTDGNTEYYKCSGCNKLFSDAEGKNETTLAAVKKKALGHNYGEPVWTWSADGKTATVKFVCANDKTHTATSAVTVKSAVKTAAACTVKGTATYTATTTFGGKTYKQTKDVQNIAALGHKTVFVAAKAATATATGNNAYYKCSACGKLFSDASCTKETTLAAVTIPVIKQTFTYGDVDNDGKITAADARLALRASVGLEKYSTGSAQYNACDVDADGKITAADARLILRASVGLEKQESLGKKR